jgi:drug/metabolite transporter (DMT)-like permease
VTAAVVGSFAYGVTVVIGRDLAQAGFGPAVGLGVRFGIAAALLFAVQAAGRRALVPVRGERIAAVLLGGVGYAVEATFFYLGLARGSAAAVALLFYTYPGIVAVFEIPFTGRFPHKPVVAALGLSAAGTALLTASGQSIAISTAGIAFALASSVTVAVYVIGAERLLRTTDSLTSAAWVALSASVALLAGAVVQGHFHLPRGHRLELVGYGLSTAVAFVMLFQALRSLGSSRTSVIMTLEAFFAAVLAAAFLGEGLGPLHAVGGGAILAGAVVVSLNPPPPQ